MIIGPLSMIQNYFVWFWLGIKEYSWPHIFPYTITYLPQPTWRNEKRILMHYLPIYFRHICFIYMTNYFRHSFMQHAFHPFLCVGPSNHLVPTYTHRPPLHALFARCSPKDKHTKFIYKRKLSFTCIYYSYVLDYFKKMYGWVKGMISFKLPVMSHEIRATWTWKNRYWLCYTR